MEHFEPSKRNDLRRDVNIRLAPQEMGISFGLKKTARPQRKSEKVERVH